MDRLMHDACFCPTPDAVLDLLSRFLKRHVSLAVPERPIIVDSLFWSVRILSWMKEVGFFTPGPFSFDDIFGVFFKDDFVEFDEFPQFMILVWRFEKTDNK